jgi:putative FmdB family regulatory protein
LAYNVNPVRVIPEEEQELPIYEYECGKCGVFEVMQKITDDALERCPRCKRKVKKLISESSFVLKGSGWYATDYAKKDKGNGKDGKGVDLSSDSKDSKDSKSKSSGAESKKESSEKSSSSSKKD